MSINLYTSYYIDQVSIRQQEIELCIKKNLNNDAVDKIYILAEPGSWDMRDGNHAICDSKLTIITHDQPTYSHFFEISNSLTGEDDINIVVNSDIYLGDNIQDISSLVDHDTVACISRWESEDELQDRPRGDSQDTWAWRGRIKTPDSCNFNLGVPGCDNRIAWELANVGYQLINPCQTVKTFHVHDSKIRNYSVAKAISPPHLFVPYGKITQLPGEGE